jgi:hypothetical protein
MPSTMKIEFVGEFKEGTEKRGQATAVHLMGEAFDALKAKMVELGLLNVTGDIRTIPERKAKEAPRSVVVEAPVPDMPPLQIPEDIGKRHGKAA